MPFTIVRDDLTRMQVDAIVNTANPQPLIGSGTDYAIYKAAGAEKLLKERQKIGSIECGQAAVTGAYGLPSRYIIHTVGPVWLGGNAGEEDYLRSCYLNSLLLALKKKCKSIAFPLISTGNYRFPKDLALRIVIDTVNSFLEEHEMMIYLVVFGANTTRLSETLFENIVQRIDDHYADTREEEEYFTPYPMADVSFTADYHIQEPENEANFRRLRDAEFRDYARREHAPLEEYYDVPLQSVPQPMEKPSLDSSLQLKAAKPSKRNLKKLLDQQNETFSQMLLRLIREKGLTNAQAYKRANQDKKLFSKIKSNAEYQPKKKTAMAFALALELNLDETRDLLSRAGYAFSPSSNFDKVIQYCIETQEYNIIEIEIILYELGLESLCNFE